MKIEMAGERGFLKIKSTYYLHFVLFCFPRENIRHFLKLKRPCSDLKTNKQHGRHALTGNLIQDES